MKNINLDLDTLLPMLIATGDVSKEDLQKWYRAGRAGEVPTSAVVARGKNEWGNHVNVFVSQKPGSVMAQRSQDGKRIRLNFKQAKQFERQPENDDLPIGDWDEFGNG